MKKNKQVKLFNIGKLRFAPEIEVEFPNKHNSSKLIDRHSIIKGWTITYDGSLDNGAEYKPKNSNKLYLNEESKTQIKEILALIKVHGGKVTKTCGLHIHIDCSKFTAKQIHTIITEWIHKQRYIIKRFKVHPDRIEQYCKLLPKEGLQKISINKIEEFRRSDSKWSSRFYDYFEEKYYSLNISHLAKGDYGTIEFRLFEATLKYRLLVEYITWTLNFIREAIERD